MIHVIDEGHVLPNGIIFYPFGSLSFGFRFRYGPKLPVSKLRSKIFQFRYSKIAKKLYVGRVN